MEYRIEKGENEVTVNDRMREIWKEVITYREFLRTKKQEYISHQSRY